MFHRKDKDSSSSNSSHRKRSLFHRKSKDLSNYQPSEPSSNKDSTPSDWDHYAVKHQEALVGDPVPIVDNGLNMNNSNTNVDSSKNNDLSTSSSSGAVATDLDKNGNILTGPVTANGPLEGNYSSGTLLENERSKLNDAQNPSTGRTTSSSWGSEPLFGDSAPRYGFRDYRDNRTPLMPDNPWTHNELGRDYSDSYSHGSLPYGAINNAWIAPSQTQSFHRSGPNGRSYDETTNRFMRRDIAPGPVSSYQSTRTDREHVLIPIESSSLVEDIIIRPAEYQPINISHMDRSNEFPINSGRNMEIKPLSFDDKVDVNTGKSVNFSPLTAGSDSTSNLSVRQGTPYVPRESSIGQSSSSSSNKFDADKRMPSWYSSSINETKAQ